MPSNFLCSSLVSDLEYSQDCDDGDDKRIVNLGKLAFEQCCPDEIQKIAFSTVRDAAIPQE